MKKITYGAPRLVDWVAQLKVGSATVRVHFTGGALTSYGVTPAEYTTSNAFIQKAIENSRYFKEGRIILLRVCELRQDSGTKVKGSVKGLPRVAHASRPKGEECVTEVATPSAVDAKVEKLPDQEAVSEPEGEEDVATGLTKVAVTCLPDAHAYLLENFNIPSYKIRSYEAAQRAAGEHGVEFTGGRFDTLATAESMESETAEEA